MDYKEKVIALLNNQELSNEQKEKLELIFPELAESEDESTRKAITEFSRTIAKMELGKRFQMLQNGLIGLKSKVSRNLLIGFKNLKVNLLMLLPNNLLNGKKSILKKSLITEI